MALIACTVCKHQISDQARVCPSCGHPIANIAASRAAKRWMGGCWWVVGVLAFCALGILLLLVLATIAPAR